MAFIEDSYDLFLQTAPPKFSTLQMQLHILIEQIKYEEVNGNLRDLRNNDLPQKNGLKEEHGIVV